MKSENVAASRSAIAAEVVGVAAAPECEIGRPVERPQRSGVEVALVESVEDGSDARGPLGHPRWRLTLGRRRWVDAWRELEALKPGHELVGWEWRERAKALRHPFLLRGSVVSGPRRFEKREAQEPVAVGRSECERHRPACRIADEMEPSEAVRIRSPENTVDLETEAITRGRLVTGVYLELFRDRVDSLPEHL